MGELSIVGSAKLCNPTDVVAIPQKTIVATELFVVLTIICVVMAFSPLAFLAIPAIIISVIGMLGTLAGATFLAFSAMPIIDEWIAQKKFHALVDVLQASDENKLQDSKNTIDGEKGDLDNPIQGNIFDGQSTFEALKSEVKDTTFAASIAASGNEKAKLLLLETIRYLPPDCRVEILNLAMPNGESIALSLFKDTVSVRHSIRDILNDLDSDSLTKLTNIKSLSAAMESHKGGRYKRLNSKLSFLPNVNKE
jgi:hypothetical protein